MVKPAVVQIGLVEVASAPVCRAQRDGPALQINTNNFSAGAVHDTRATVVASRDHAVAD